MVVTIFQHDRRMPPSLSIRLENCRWSTSTDEVSRMKACFRWAVIYNVDQDYLTLQYEAQRTKNREDFCLAMKLYRQWNCEYLNAMAGLCDPMLTSRFLQFRPNTLFLNLRFSKCPGIRTQISI